MRHQDRLGESFEPVLRAAQAGAGWAFERLWHAYSPAVAGYLQVQRAPDSDGLVSDVFLGAFRSLASFSGDEGSFRSWLFTIAHRRLVDGRRQAARLPEAVPLSAEELLTDPEPGPETVILERAARDRVRSLCGRLAPDQRDVLLLRLLGGFTVPEVAGAVNKSPGAVKALQRRGLAALQRMLQREGVPL